MSLPLRLSVTKLSRCPASRAAASMPKSRWEGPNCSVSTAMTPSVLDRPPASTRAAVLAWYPRAATASSTRRRVSSATPGNPLSTRDTVMTDTPARAATSAMTARRGCSATVTSRRSRTSRRRRRPRRRTARSCGRGIRRSLRWRGSDHRARPRVWPAACVLEPERHRVGSVRVRTGADGQDDGAAGTGASPTTASNGPMRARATTRSPLGRRRRSARSRPGTRSLPPRRSRPGSTQVRTRQWWCCWRRPTNVGSGESSVASPPCSVSQPGRAVSEVSASGSATDTDPVPWQRRTVEVSRTSEAWGSCRPGAVGHLQQQGARHRPPVDPLHRREKGLPSQRVEAR